jgi:dCTP deaminase
MILSDSKILAAIEAGDIVIDPFKRENLNAHSYDVTLGNTFKMYDTSETEKNELVALVKHHYGIGKSRPATSNFYTEFLDSKSKNETVEFEIPESGIVLFPGHLYLMHTVERVNSRIYAPNLHGKSSIGRLGIAIHVTAGYGDAGFEGKHWTLEVSVVLPVKVYPGMRIGQIQFEVVDGEILQRYDQNPNSKYNGDNKAEASKMHRNF